jgi:hypothetical protein
MAPASRVFDFAALLGEPDFVNLWLSRRPTRAWCSKMLLLDFGSGVLCGWRRDLALPQRSAPAAGYGLPQPPVGPRQSGKGSSKIALPGTQT